MPGKDGLAGLVGVLRKLCEEEWLQNSHQLTHWQGIPISKILYCIVQGCINKKSLSLGREVNYLVIRSGLEVDNFLGSHLIRMFSLCGSLWEATQAFRKLPEPDVYSWSAVISAYVKHDQSEEAVKLYQEMKESKVKSDQHIYVAILQGCTSAASLIQGKLVHADIVASDLESNIFVGCTLIDMYSKCGCLKDARDVFEKMPQKDVVSWSSMIAGYASNGHSQESILLFQKMQEEGMDPNFVTFVSILKASSSLHSLDRGKLIHTLVIQHSCELDIFVGNALVDMYFKCGSFEDAHRIFDNLPKQDVVACSAMVAGYVQHGHEQDALLLFRHMQHQGFNANGVTFTLLLKVCSDMVVLDEGKYIHASILETGFELDEFVGNALIDMYAKCGSLEDASLVFAKLQTKSVVTWNAMIGGYVLHQHYDIALRFFEKMQEEGLKPDNVTFVWLLLGCSHMGLMDQACEHFKLMKEIHGILPTLEHHNCMVELLGRTGLLNEAEDLLQTLPLLPSSAGWLSLLTNCRMYGNIDVGRRCFDHLVAMDCRYASGYAIMSKIYTNAHMWEDSTQVQELRKCADAWKEPGKACIEIHNKVHGFIVGEKLHPESDIIYAKLGRLSVPIKEGGHMPQLDLVPLPFWLHMPQLDLDQQDVTAGQ